MEDSDKYSTDFTKCLKYLNAHAAEIIASPRKRTENSSTLQQDSAAGDTAPAQQTQDSTLEILVMGGLGGRVDQAFSQVHHLYMMTQTQRELRETTHKNDENRSLNSAAGGNLYLISEESITFVLQQGKNIIHTPATRRPDIESVSRTEVQAGEGKTPRKRKHGEAQEPQYFFEENIGIIPLSAPASITTRGLEWDVHDWHTEIGGQISTSNHIRADTVEVKTSVPVLFTMELAQELKRE